MADASPQIRLPGRKALSGRPADTHANQDGGKPGLVIEELVHLGKLNIRGAADILPGITAQTGCQSLPENNRCVTIGERHLAGLARMNICCCAKLIVKMKFRRVYGRISRVSTPPSQT